MNWLLISIATLAVAAVAFFVFFRRNFDTVEKVRLEMDVIDAKAKAKKLLVNKDASEVRRQLEAEHKETIERMDSEQRERAKHLADDPVALAAFLVRAGKG